MPTANPTFDAGVCTVVTDSEWLNVNGEIPVCLAQPALVDPALVSVDGARPDSLALARAIFELENGQRRLSRWFDGQNGLLLFPEYAFSSADFAALNQLVADHPSPLIAIAGFGAVDGAGLPALEGHVYAGRSAAGSGRALEQRGPRQHAGEDRGERL